MAVPEFIHLRQCARTMVFETGNADAPFSVSGTGFIVGFRNFIFVLTARHVVLDWPKEWVAIILSPEGERLLYSPTSQTSKERKSHVMISCATIQNERFIWQHLVYWLGSTNRKNSEDSAIALRIIW